MWSLRDVLGNLTQTQGVFRTLREQFALQDYWLNQFDGGVTAQARVNRMDKGDLVFEVFSPVWATQLRFYSGNILQKFQKQWPEVRRVRFQLATPETASSNLPDQETLSPVLIENLPVDTWDRLQLKARVLREARLAAGWQVCKCCQGIFPQCVEQECLICRQTARTQKVRMLTSQIVEAPWERDGRQGEEFTRLRENLRNQTQDQIQSLYWQYQKEPSPELKKRMLSLLQQFASLKTGLSPEKLNDKIISEAIGKTFYQRWLKISKA